MTRTFLPFPNDVAAPVIKPTFTRSLTDIADLKRGQLADGATIRTKAATC
jgi:hypothetical protein